MLRLEAEAARHTAAAGIDETRVVTGQPQRRQRRFRPDKRLLVAVGVQQHLAAVSSAEELSDRFIRRRQAPDELVEEQRLPRDGARRLVSQQVGVLVPQRQEAGRLRPDDRQAMRGVRQQGVDVAPCPALRCRQQALRDRRPPQQPIFSTRTT